MLTDNEYQLAEQVIKLHDGNHYQALKNISRLPEEGCEDDPISEEEYLSMCQDLEDEMGDIEQIQLIDVLIRSDSKLTLWKVKYVKSDFLVFWGISFDPKSLNVDDVMVHW